MMGIMNTGVVDESYAVDNTFQYLLLLLLKVALNTFILGLCLQSLHSSFMGICSISFCVADTLLLCGISYLQLFQGDTGSAASACFLLGHASVVYSMLPFPVVLLGGLDYAQYFYTEHNLSPACRTAACSLLVSLLWVVACVRSYLLRDPKLVEVQYPLNRRDLLCPVEDSSVVVCFCTAIAIGCIILFFFHEAPRWLRIILFSQWTKADPHSTVLTFDKVQYDSKDRSILFHGQEQDIPLFFNLAVGFMQNWTPFIVINITCALLDYAMPAYITVNLLWLLCTNSLLIRLGFWASGRWPDHAINLLDSTSNFTLSWHREVMPKKIHTVSRQGHGDIMHDFGSTPPIC
ncbi:putative G-protein coupled receptor 160 isoform X1 [Arapaima gigas]